MRQELFQILDTYEDFELAFLWKYKLDAYLEDTRAAILKYIQTNRRLSAIALESLIEEYTNRGFDDDQQRCPRCKSTKIAATDEEYWNTANQSQLVLLASVYADNRKANGLVCAVCDYVIRDLNNRIGLWHQVKRLLSAKLFRKR